MPTNNFYIGEEDGWVEIVTGPADFIRVSGAPYTHPYYLFSDTTAPPTADTHATGTITLTDLPLDGETVTIGNEVYSFKVGPKATGAVYFEGIPLEDETVTIGSEVYVFKAAPVNPFEVLIGATENALAANFVATVTADSTLVDALATGPNVTVTAKVGGPNGNYSLAEAATGVVVSGAAMTGGAVPVTTGAEVAIGADEVATAQNLVTSINRFSTIVSAANTAPGVVTVTSGTAGSTGDYPLSEAATNVTVSGATLTGGLDVAEGILVCHHPFWVDVPMTTENLYARIVNPVPNSARRDGKIRLDVFTV